MSDAEKWKGARIARSKRKTKEKWRANGHSARPTPEARQTLVKTAPVVQGRARKGLGVACHDIWRPEEHAQASAVSVDDDRRGQVQCRDCGAFVQVVEVGGTWTPRDEDGTPHRLTCSGGVGG